MECTGPGVLQIKCRKPRPVVLGLHQAVRVITLLTELLTYPRSDSSSPVVRLSVIVIVTIASHHRARKKRRHTHHKNKPRKRETRGRAKKKKESGYRNNGTHNRINFWMDSASSSILNRGNLHTRGPESLILA